MTPPFRGINASTKAGVVHAHHPGPLPPLIVPPGQAELDRPAPSLTGYDQLLAGAVV